MFFGNFQDFLIIFGQNWTCPKKSPKYIPLFSQKGIYLGEKGIYLGEKGIYLGEKGIYLGEKGEKRRYIFLHMYI